MTNFEIAEIAKTIDMFDLASKTRHNLELSDVEKDAVGQLDAWAREIGKTGKDANHEIAAFISKTIDTDIYNTPDELLDRMFNRANIGANDDFELEITPKNTLIAHEAAQGGNVDRSFLDISVVTPTWKHRQVETDISYADLSRNGWKSVALITTYAKDALRNAMFTDIFNVVDTGIASGADNYFTSSGGKLGSTAMDQLALYVNDRTDGDGVCVALSKWIQQASKFTGFLSDKMLNDLNRSGRLGEYDGVSLYPISGARKLGDGNLLLTDNRLFGIAGKIGELDMRGDIRVLQTMDNNKENVHLKITGFNYGWAFNDSALENMCKIVITS